MTGITADAIIAHLGALVAADSSDPVETMSPEHPAIVHAVRSLEGADCAVDVTDLGGGCVNVLAVRGEPTTLFNCHLDTVRLNPNWTRDPFTLTVEGGRAYGLGACDIKGAAACMLSVAQETEGPIAILLTTDEEGGRGTCVGEFLRAHGAGWERVVVAEPTEARAVLQHRGFASFEVNFRGTAGHTSGAGAADDSALHRAVAWASSALALAEPGGLLGNARFNIGIMNGGTASNVVASEAIVRFGFRPEPGADAECITADRIRALKHLLPKDGSADWADRFLAPPLTSGIRTAQAVEQWGVAAGDDVDFWTEAALFAAGGLPALVLGPGNIAQAHAADEFVEIAQLESCARAYESIVGAAANTGLVAGLGASPGMGGGVDAP